MKKIILLLALAFTMSLGSNAYAQSVAGDALRAMVDRWEQRDMERQREWERRNSYSYSYGAPLPQSQPRPSAVESHRALMDQLRYESSLVQPPRVPTHEEMCRFLAPPGGDRQFCFEN